VLEKKYIYILKIYFVILILKIIRKLKKYFNIILSKKLFIKAISIIILNIHLKKST